MHAMNHAVTALALKKNFKHVPLAWLLVSVQLMELLWVAFNWLGLERVTTEAHVSTIADVHLSHMPYSHSVASAVLLAVVVYFCFRRAGLALALGVLSHLVLDLLTHVPDISIAWFGSDLELGTGLYALPLAAFVVETVYGVLVWRYVRGRIALLGAILAFQVSTLSAHVAWITGAEAQLATRPTLLAAAVAVQIAVTLPLVWWLGRASSPTAQRPWPIVGSARPSIGNSVLPRRSAGSGMQS